MKNVKLGVVSVTRMNGTHQTWELVAKPVTSILTEAAGLNGGLADKAISRACRAGLLEVYGTPERAMKALGNKLGAAKCRVLDGGSVKQLLVDALDLHPQDVTEIGPYRLVNVQ